MTARRACVGVMQQRARHRLQHQREAHQQYRRHQHPGDDHAARKVFGKLGDVAERQQAGHQHGPAQQQVRGEFEPAGDDLGRLDCAAATPPA